MSDTVVDYASVLCAIKSLVAHLAHSMYPIIHPSPSVIKSCVGG